VTRRFAALLRGINVGPHHRVSMPDLRGAFEAAGYEDVTTYVQSGNVLFDAGGRATPARLESAIAAVLEDRLELAVPVLVRSGDEMTAVIAANPFVAAGHDRGHLHVAFLRARPPTSAVVALQGRDFGAERLAVAGREVYLLCPAGYGRTKLTPPMLERALGSPSTTRNWKSVLAIGELARA
jgi:uncharacterized protein (DUF1697 family)